MPYPYNNVNTVPIDRTAAIVIGKGTQCQVGITPDDQSHWEVCPPLRSSTWLKYNLRTPNFTGVKYGRLTVVGVSKAAGKASARGGKWVVRCACGEYEVRTAKSIQKNFDDKNPYEMCLRCKRVRNLSRDPAAISASRAQATESASALVDKLIG